MGAPPRLAKLRRSLTLRVSLPKLRSMLPLLLILPRAFAQGGDDPDPCGALCDLVDTLLYVTPLATGALGAVIAAILHLSVASGAARTWAGGSVGTMRLWLVPLLGAFAPPLLGLFTLVGLAIRNEDFRILLMLDAQSLPSALVWAVGTLLIPLIPLAVAHLRIR